MDYKEILRRERLNALLLWHESEISWAVGVSVKNACLLLTENGGLLIAPQGTENIPAGVLLREYEEYGFPEPANPCLQLKQMLEEALQCYRVVGFTTDKMALQVQMSLEHIVWKNVTEAVCSSMLSKPKETVDRIRQAMVCNDNAFWAVRGCLRPGMEELEIRAVVERAYHELCGEVIPSGGDFLSGPRTAEISGPPTRRVVQEGEPVILDLQASYKGVGIDTTRTFFCGAPSAAMKEAYHAVEHALRLGETLLVPGQKAFMVYERLAGELEARGYGRLPHHGGHGVGYRWYEPPYLIPGDNRELEPGMIIALEPGVYHKEFGIRLENNYLITESGCENLTKCPTQLEWATIVG